MSDAEKDLTGAGSGPGSEEQRGEEFMQAFKKGAEFTQDPLKENERLRFRMIELEEAVRTGSGEAGSSMLEEKVKKLETEKAEILERIIEVEDENEDFANRYVEVE